MKQKTSKSTPKVKEPVRIRQKALKHGGFSLYLDCNVNGNRWPEFLKLYLLPNNVPNAKQQNAETLELATAIKGRRIAELQNETHGFSNNKIRSKINLLDYIESIAIKRKERVLASGKKKACSYASFMNVRHHLIQYKGNKITFQQVDKAFCLGFIEYLRTAKSKRYKKKQVNLSPNSQLEYVNRFRAVLFDAIADDIISSSPLKQIRKEDKPKGYMPEIEYLTNQELNLLANTPYKPCPGLKQAFLFSCYTGLRFSDVENLTWDRLRKNDVGRTLIKFVQGKTTKPEYPPISDKAVRWLPERGMANDADCVFNLPANAHANKLLRNWVTLAGLKKRITYHVSRHTTATLLLSSHVPLTTVQKIMGHADIRTTLRYAKVIDKSVSDAVEILDNLPDSF
ncbi:MAG: site-specific integrase [Bacteroidales bacterium]|jgi:integrase|nr:site-specific integrase [Bacteroidales bacterium]